VLGPEQREPTGDHHRQGDGGEHVERDGEGSARRAELRDQHQRKHRDGERHQERQRQVAAKPDAVGRGDARGS
jgi:hypothetical protein